jgi:hypothetical protein
MKTLEEMVNSVSDKTIVLVEQMYNVGSVDGREARLMAIANIRAGFTFLAIDAPSDELFIKFTEFICQQAIKEGKKIRAVVKQS